MLGDATGDSGRSCWWATRKTSPSPSFSGMPAPPASLSSVSLFVAVARMCWRQHIRVQTIQLRARAASFREK
jgi:hypothetical protein